MEVQGYNPSQSKAGAHGRGTERASDTDDRLRSRRPTTTTTPPHPHRAAQRGGGARRTQVPCWWCGSTLAILVVRYT